MVGKKNGRTKSKTGVQLHEQIPELHSTVLGDLLDHSLFELAVTPSLQRVSASDTCPCSKYIWRWKSAADSGSGVSKPQSINADSIGAKIRSTAERSLLSLKFGSLSTYALKTFTGRLLSRALCFSR